MSLSILMGSLLSIYPPCGCYIYIYLIWQMQLTRGLETFRVENGTCTKICSHLHMKSKAVVVVELDIISNVIIFISFHDNKRGTHRPTRAGYNTT